jgi:hypothetical protein
MLVFSMIAMAILSRFIHHSRLGSGRLFAIVWLVVGLFILANHW